MLDPGQWVLLAGIILTFILPIYLGSRQRKWELENRKLDREDRERLAEKEAHERKEVATQLKITTISEAEEVARKVLAAANLLLRATEATAIQAAIDRAEIAQAIEENKDISREAASEARTAAKEANHVNEKLKELGIDRNALEREKQESQQAMGEVVLDTHAKVTEIHEEVTDNK